MAKKKKNQEEKAKVAEELDGLSVNIDRFGEIQNSLSIDKINEFLNKNVDDKKLRDRDDLKDSTSNEEEE
ncbi:hypothetical protein [Roseivirga misakiensis]|uniref:Uncharacterized protein n=1 Tax=Roseivirga misakiensis TaxID=1563681 RepID=A0A1E5T3Q6_9BACT|nr:hypothetical protein [Roseivirga misakiensis]OEK05907.1 hypothetical protein BFP71_07275 [Roseivirga misakiensis]